MQTKITRLAWVGILGLIGTLIPLAVSPAGAAPRSAKSPASEIQVHAVRFDPATGATLAVVNSDIHSSTGRVSASVADPVTTAPAGVMAAAASGGCCSAAGGWNLAIRVCNGSCGFPNFIYHSRLIFCWGGGVPGVHWGYVHNCAYPAGSATYPAMSDWFTNVSYPDRNPRHTGTDAFYFGWAPMRYSYNTGFYDHQSGAVDVCTIACYFSHNPSINIWAHANGEYDYSTSAG